MTAAVCGNVFNGHQRSRLLTPGAFCPEVRRGRTEHYTPFGFAVPLPAATEPRRQTLLSLQADSGRLSPLWIGFGGPDHRLSVSLQPQHGRSPHSWLGPSLRPGSQFDIQIALHSDMGPGGVLWRDNDQSPWSSLEGASPWGPERLDCQGHWVVGSAAGGNDMCFSGSDLSIRQFCCQGTLVTDDSSQGAQAPPGRRFSPTRRRAFFIRACALISKRAWRWCTLGAETGGGSSTPPSGKC